jgi:hypothetical protein
VVQVSDGEVIPRCPSPADQQEVNLRQGGLIASACHCLGAAAHAARDKAGKERKAGEGKLNAAMLRTGQGLLRPLRTALKKVHALIFRPPQAYLAKCHGVIHVGANAGQERDLYAAHGLSVVWIEPSCATTSATTQRNKLSTL